jgi:uncharacterized membrane protein YgcG
MKSKIIKVSLATLVATVALFNISIAFDNETESDLLLFNVEALSTEWNDWTQWLSQGFTKDEEELVEPCPTDQSSSGSGSVSYGGGSISGSGSSNSTNPSNRHDIRCKYGSENCTSVDC